MGCCTICLEDYDGVGFNCLTKNCAYEMCTDCVKDAFKDASGGNYRNCLLCKRPVARSMLESICGPGVVREVERELRSKVEFEVNKANLKRQGGKEEMGEMKERARKLFNELSELLNMKCPRCCMVFHDYDGCNALNCGNPECGAAFCAVCLEDCGSDAHSHVRRYHGDLFSKDKFYRAKRERETDIVDRFLRDIDEPFEVRELIKIDYDKSMPDVSAGSSGTMRYCNDFLQDAKENLRSAVKSDRLSVLSDTDGRRQMRIDSTDVSPRSAIPTDEYRLYLESDSLYSSVVQIVLSKRIGTKWRRIPLPDDEKPSEDKPANEPKVDALINIKQSLLCGVIAFKNATKLYQTKFVPPTDKNKRLGDDEISVSFLPVSNGGDVLDSEDGRTLCDIGCNEIDVLAVNQNLRLMLLQRHINSKSSEDLLFEALRHFVSNGSPKRIFNEIPVPAPETFNDLNPNQQQVAHPLSLKSAMEVAGPPGTGKTKTITELVRGVMQCTEYDVIVLSERNGAIDAIAEKIAGDCLKLSSRNKVKGVSDVSLWTIVLAYGSAGGMGPYAKLFTLSEKLKHHPELVELRRIVSVKMNELDLMKKPMLQALANKIYGIREHLPEDADAWKRMRVIESGTEAGLDRPSDIVFTVSSTHDNITSLLLKPSTVTDADICCVVTDNSAILGHLIPISTEHEDGATGRRSSSSNKMLSLLPALKHIANSLKRLLDDELFSVESVENAELGFRDAENDLNAAKARIQGELTSGARVLMSTIGSSHKLIADETDDDDSSLAGGFGRMALDDNGKRTVVVFDEAGCIPSYELLGLTRLGRSIQALVCVGDEHQLPPYDPSASMRKSPRSRSGNFVDETKIKSLLDASKLTVDDGKIKLTTQYRVPRDIASLLNARVYRGDYRTADSCRAPLRGFYFIHSPYSRSGDTKYVNEGEIRQCLDLVEEYSVEGNYSIMVLTPYKKQQRQLQHKLKRAGYGEDVKVLTIDQCQGQEADIVIISLVQRPTRFLNKNRLNVALSRVRKKLYVVADRKDFEDASKRSEWECHLIAKDMMDLMGEEIDEDEEQYW